MNRPPRTQQDLARLLGRLRDAGVAEAAFHPDGRLAAVTFAGALPTKDGELKGDTAEPPTVSMARRAFAVVTGGRESMEDQ